MEGGGKTSIAGLVEVGRTWQEGDMTWPAALLEHGRSWVSGRRQHRWVADRLVGESSSVR